MLPTCQQTHADRRMQKPMNSLDRFVTAQAGVFETARGELAAGRKRSHWMWFVFPQLQGLGRSETARFYGIASLAEARQYLAHPLLGSRLEDVTAVVLALPGHSPTQLFGQPDDLKFASCMTLFDVARPGGCFDAALQRFFDGRRDPQTLQLLAAHGASSPPSP